MQLPMRRRLAEHVGVLGINYMSISVWKESTLAPASALGTPVTKMFVGFRVFGMFATLVVPKHDQLCK